MKMIRFESMKNEYNPLYNQTKSNHEKKKQPDQAEPDFAAS